MKSLLVLAIILHVCTLSLAYTSYVVGNTSTLFYALDDVEDSMNVAAAFDFGSLVSAWSQLILNPDTMSQDEAEQLNQTMSELGDRLNATDRRMKRDLRVINNRRSDDGNLTIVEMASYLQFRVYQLHVLYLFDSWMQLFASPSTSGIYALADKCKNNWQETWSILEGMAYMLSGSNYTLITFNFVKGAFREKPVLGIKAYFLKFLQLISLNRAACSGLLTGTNYSAAYTQAHLDYAADVTANISRAIDEAIINQKELTQNVTTFVISDQWVKFPPPNVSKEEFVATQLDDLVVKNYDALETKLNGLLPKLMDKSTCAAIRPSDKDIRMLQRIFSAEDRNIISSRLRVDFFSGKNLNSTRDRVQKLIDVDKKIVDACNILSPLPMMSSFMGLSTVAAKSGIESYLQNASSYATQRFWSSSNLAPKLCLPLSADYSKLSSNIAKELLTLGSAFWAYGVLVHKEPDLDLELAYVKSTTNDTKVLEVRCNDYKILIFRRPAEKVPYKSTLFDAIYRDKIERVLRNQLQSGSVIGKKLVDIPAITTTASFAVLAKSPTPPPVVFASATGSDPPMIVYQKEVVPGVQLIALL